MTDRLPIPTVGGSLAGRAGAEWVLARFGYEARVTAAHFVLDVAPGSGESVDLEVRTASGGGGDALTATIAGTDRDAQASGSITTGSAGELWLRLAAVSSNGGQSAAGLSGWVAVDRIVGVSATALTTLDRVKEWAIINGTSQDALLQRLIAGASGAMQTYMRRQIAERTYDQRFSPTGATDTLTLPAFPITDPSGVTVTVGRVDASSPETLVRDEDYEVGDDALYHLTGRWPKGRRNVRVVWPAGFSSIPDELAVAATKQVVYEYHKTSPGGGRLDRRGQVLDQGGSSEFIVQAWAPGVREVLDLWREPAL